MVSKSEHFEICLNMVYITLYMYVFFWASSLCLLPFHSFIMIIMVAVFVTFGWAKGGFVLHLAIFWINSDNWLHE